MLNLLFAFGILSVKLPIFLFAFNATNHALQITMFWHRLQCFGGNSSKALVNHKDRSKPSITNNLLKAYFGPITLY